MCEMASLQSLLFVVMQFNGSNCGVFCPMMRYGKFATGISHGFFGLRIACRQLHDAHQCSQLLPYKEWRPSFLKRKKETMKRDYFRRRCKLKFLRIEQDASSNNDILRIERQHDLWSLVMTVLHSVICNHIIVGCGPANRFISLCHADVPPAEVQTH